MSEESENKKSTSHKKTKKNNPLYVVKNNGKDVEAAKSIFEMLIKKLNLEPVMQFITMYIKALLEQVNSYAALQFVNLYLNSLFEMIFTKLQSLNFPFLKV